ncbi:Aa trans domain-containing protein [Citrus sinensis]|nr:Aa trans domain-containing protein [Citrus sinensis]
MSTPLHENEKKEVSFLKTCINGTNALSGIGILSVPYALSSGGWLSLIILVLIAAAASFTALLIRRCMDKDPDAMTSYIDIVGDNLHKLSPHFDLKLGKLNVDGRHSFVVLAGVMILPTMWLNDLGVLSYVSAGGVLSSMIVTVCVFFVGATKGVGFHGKGRLFNLNGIPTALSLYTFCYGAHAVFPPIYNSMRKKIQFSRVLLISFAICTITYLTMAVLGYLIYGQNVQSQVSNYKIVMPIATAIENRLAANYKDCKSASILIRMSLLVSTVVLAAVFPSFQSVTSLSGAFLIVVVSFLLPCVCYLKIFQVHRNWGYELIGILIIMLLPVFVGVLGTYSSIAQTVKQV